MTARRRYMRLAQVCNSPFECLAREIGEQTVFDAKAWAATWVLTARTAIDALEKKWGDRTYA